MQAELIRPIKAGVVVRVRLTPKSSTDAVEGMVATAEGQALQARVRTAPTEGEANDALVRLVAAWASLPKSTISVRHGHKSRIKVVLIAGPPGPLQADIERRIGLFAADKKQS